MEQLLVLFFLAIYHNKINCVRTLIEMGADVNNSLFPERNRIDEKPLEFAAILDRTNIARLLIESGADATFTQGGHSPIFHAIQNNNLDLTRILVESGADINHIDSNYYYNKLPLIHFAIHFGTYNMVKLLIELGANLKIKNNDGETPLMFAIKLKETKKPKNINKIIKLFSESSRIDTTEVDDKISVFNPLMFDEEPASTFFEEQKEYDPFIIRGFNGKYNGEAIGWPASSSSGKMFLECKDNAPVSWQGFTYSKWLKPNGRKFIKMNIAGSIFMVETPEWYSSGVPGTRYFKLVKLPDKVYKFVSSVLASDKPPPGWEAIGADHCNQTMSDKDEMAKMTPEEIKNAVSIGTYRLEEITLEELKADIEEEKAEEKTDIEEEKKEDEGKGVKRKRQSVKKIKECHKRNKKTGRCISRKKTNK